MIDVTMSVEQMEIPEGLDLMGEVDDGGDIFVDGTRFEVESHDALAGVHGQTAVVTGDTVKCQRVRDLHCSQTGPPFSQTQFEHSSTLKKNHFCQIYRHILMG